MWHILTFLHHDDVFYISALTTLTSLTSRRTLDLNCRVRRNRGWLAHYSTISWMTTIPARDQDMAVNVSIILRRFCFELIFNDMRYCNAIVNSLLSLPSPLDHSSNDTGLKFCPFRPFFSVLQEAQQLSEQTLTSGVWDQYQKSLWYVCLAFYTQIFYCMNLDGILLWNIHVTYTSNSLNFYYGVFALINDKRKAKQLNVFMKVTTGYKALTDPMLYKAFPQACTDTYCFVCVS